MYVMYLKCPLWLYELFETKIIKRKKQMLEETVGPVRVQTIS